MKCLGFVLLFGFISLGAIGGCSNNNGNSNIIGPDGGTVTTSDGRFTLEIPPGALTEDTEITITRDGTFDGDVLVYDAQPEGLEFLLPAILSGDVSDISNNNGSNTNVMIGFNIVGEDAEELGEQTYDVDLLTGMATYTAEVNHFSQLWLLDGLVGIVFTTVPDTNPANSLLVNFDVCIRGGFKSPFPPGIDIPVVIDGTIAKGVYSDFSSPMVLYNGETTPLDLIEDEEEVNEFCTVQRYDCGDPGKGLFNIELVISGVTQLSDDNLIPGIPTILPFSETPFNIRVPGTQPVTCTSTVTPPPPPTEPPMMPPPPTEPPPPPPSEPVSISADTDKINITHNRGGSPCPQQGTPIKITVMGGEGEFRIVVKESLSFLTVTPGNKLTNMGMATLTPSFPCSGFIVGTNNGTITVEVQDPDTGEVLDTIEIPVMVTVN